MYIDELTSVGERISSSVSVFGDCALVTTQKGSEIWVDGRDSCSVVVVYLVLLDEASVRMGKKDMAACLFANGKFSLVRGAWIGLHRESDTLRLISNIEKKYVDEGSLERVIINLEKIFMKMSSHKMCES